MTKGNKCLRKYAPSLLLFLLFEAVAVTLWLTKDNLFYLLNFSYIGGCLAAGDGALHRREAICPSLRAAGGGQLYAAVSRRDLPREYAA